MATFREQTRNKNLKVGTYIGEFATSGIGRLLKAAGAEFAFVDMEHSGFSFETAKQVLRHLHDVGIATVLRPPSKSIHHLSRACDIGAQGVVLPMLGTVEEAKRGVDALNYPPKGTRGCAFGIAHDDYQPTPVMEAINAANDKTTFVALIETAEGVENCEAICTTEGVDCIWIGHFDLSASLGIPGEFNHPVFVNSVARIMNAAKANGTNVGRLVGSAEEGHALYADGCDFICYLGDIWLFHRALCEGFDAIRSGINATAKAGEK